MSNLKIAAARQALEHVKESVREDSILGIGSGSTVNCFIDLLGSLPFSIKGVVSGSHASTERLRQAGIDVIDMNSVSELSLYVDGADEVDEQLNLIKGGGGALTSEKIIASLAQQFVCMVDESKRVRQLGTFPLPIEVIPMARSWIARQMVLHFHAEPVYRQGFISDHGNPIIDVHGLSINDPEQLERQLNNLPGVITNGLFAQHKPDVVIIAQKHGVEVVVK